MPYASFERRLTELLNEKMPASRTPAWIMAQFLISCMETFNRSCLSRDEVVADRKERIELVKQGKLPPELSGAVTIIHPADGVSTP